MLKDGQSTTFRAPAFFLNIAILFNSLIIIFDDLSYGVVSHINCTVVVMR